MKKIKFLKENRIELDGVRYKGYSICSIPSIFGAIEELVDEDGYVVARLSLVDEWFNYKGLTYIIE